MTNWLEKICVENNLTFYHLSKKSSVAQSTLSNIKNKNISVCDIKFGTALSISHGLGMTPTEFINAVCKIEFDI